MRGDHHAVAQAAFLECSLKVGHTLVAVSRILGTGPDRRRLREAFGRPSLETLIRMLRPAVDRCWHQASRKVADEFGRLAHFVDQGSRESGIGSREP